MPAGRFKWYDYAVVGLFVVVLVGVSLAWYTVSLTYEDTSLEGGDAGWHYAWGILAFVAALLALVVAGLKGFVGPGGFVPGWYKQGVLLMGLGDLVTLFAIIGFLDKPGRGVENIGDLGFDIGYGVGIYLTLIAGLLLGACGLVAKFDKPATAAIGTTAPHLRAAGAPPPPGMGFKLYCPACNAELEPRSRVCNSCGMPLA